MTKLYGLCVKGKYKEWCFAIFGTEQDVRDWRADGLEIDEIVNRIPEWWVDLGFSVKVWCFLQDWLGI
jgi:hypothetical protein